MSRQTKFIKDEEIQVCRDIPLKEAETKADDLITFNRDWCKKIEVVGSIRRLRPSVKDIDFVVIATREGWDGIKKIMGEKFKSKKVLGGDKLLRYIVPFEIGNIQVDFYRAGEDTYGVLKLVRTGSEEHNIWLAKLAIKQGYRLLYSRGVCDGNFVLAGADEAACFHALNLEFIPPELREINPLTWEPIWDWGKYWRD